jgi:hypothetical protein
MPSDAATVQELVNTMVPGKSQQLSRKRMTSVLNIVASAGHGGSITPSAKVAIGFGLSKMFAITPRGGYSIADVEVDGVSVGAVVTYMFSNLTSDHTIRATFIRDHRPEAHPPPAGTVGRMRFRSSFIVRENRGG